MNIPVLHADGNTIPEAWENAVITLSKLGIQFKTEYDREGDPPSLDCTMILTAYNPQQEPKIHRCFPGSLEDLETYRREVVDGIHDHHVTSGLWPYSYHDRLTNYQGEVNQIESVLSKLAECLYTRRAQAITWNPFQDAGHPEPPCFQRMWLRAMPGSDKHYLNMNLHWRSRDGFKAAFMNLYAFASLQEKIAKELQERVSRSVLCGRIVDVSDSFHIYGKDLGELDGLLRQVGRRTFEERTWRSDAFSEHVSDETREFWRESASRWIEDLPETEL